MELAKIAGFMHDIGNAVNRTNHAEYGAILAYDILKEADMSMADRVTVISAIGNHDESTGGATDAISAAVIIADKTDVRRNRVRNKDKAMFDIHDRVNYAVTESKLKVDEEIYRMAECYGPVYLFEFLDRNQKVCFRQIYFRKNVFLSPELEALHEEAQFTIEEMKAMVDKRKKDQ